MTALPSHHRNHPPPSFPCAPERSCCNTGGCHRQSYSRSPYRTRTMAPSPAILHSLRSVTHEPDEEPNRLHGGGSHRRVCTCSGWHIHVDDVPGHHRHFAARHFIRLMLHCTPRCRIAGPGVIVPPCMHGPKAVKVLAWLFSPTRRLMLMAKGHQSFHHGEGFAHSYMMT